MEETTTPTEISRQLRTFAHRSRTHIQIRTHTHTHEREHAHAHEGIKGAVGRCVIRPGALCLGVKESQWCRLGSQSGTRRLRLVLACSDQPTCRLCLAVASSPAPTEDQLTCTNNKMKECHNKMKEGQTTTIETGDKRNKPTLVGRVTSFLP
jgi:hypothetical protein